jgi:glycosyltransferase involved in cell wall biosynthesis
VNSIRYRVLLVEPFYGGSHKKWIDGVRKYCDFDFDLLSLSDKNWKWRMHGGAITLANKLNKMVATKYDLVLVSDMIDLALFKSLTTHKLNGVPIAIYFHENQFAYPWSATDEDVQLKRDRHYMFINYSSALCADYVLFNSGYNMSSFLSELKKYLRVFPDNRNMETINAIEAKSNVLHLGLELKKSIVVKKSELPLTVLWNHRWENDKNPEQFFQTLIQLKSEGVSFNLVVMGEEFKNAPDIFREAREKLADRIVHWGYADSEDMYQKLLTQSDVIPVTSNQDFFGISIIEAVAHGCYPLLPKRLAYPEVVPVKECFYEDFYSSLKSLLINGLPKENRASEIAMQYSWNVMKEKYNAMFLRLIEES